MSLQKTTVELGKEYYHLQQPMQDWCYQNIGPGGWWHEPNHVWNVSSMFGNTFFEFENPADASAFILRWKW